MKFNVSSKDLVIFIIFCIFLLLLCSLSVSNAISIMNDGEFLGLNPFLGFGSKYILATLLLFVVVLIAIFASVSSYIFDREKGKGFGLNIGEKDEKGYARWSKENGEYAVEKVIQGAKTESVPLGELKVLAEERMLLFDEELMSFAMGNCIAMEDTNGNRKLIKRRYEEKIDNVSALMDAYVSYKLNKEAFE